MPCQCFRLVKSSVLTKQGYHQLRSQCAEAELAQAEADAVRKTVASRIHILDEAFLMTLGGFVRAAAEEGDSGIHGEKRQHD